MSDAEDMIAEEAAAPRSATGEHELDRFAPRIVVEAFCVTPEFASAVQSAAVDRRMTKAKSNVAMGGAAVAAKRFANICSPNLIIIETKETGFGVFAELEPLSEVCDPETKVVVAGPSNDVTLYRELIRQGVSEYLVTPASPVQVIEAITTIYADPDSSPAARTVGVYGVKGGVGASVLAHNLASSLAERRKKDTVLVDFDIEFGTAALDFNVEARHSVADALGDLDGLDEVKLQRLLYAQSDNLKLLPSPASIQAKVRFDEEAALGFIDRMRYICDTLVFDLPHAWNASARCALRQSDEVVLVATPDLASVRNLKSVFDWVKAQRLHDAPPRIVLNQVGQPKRPEIPLRDFVEIVGAEVDLALPYDAAVFGAAMNKGQMLSDIGAAKKIAAKLDEFVETLSGRDGSVGAQNAKRSSLSIGDWLGSILGK